MIERDPRIDAARTLVDRFAASTPEERARLAKAGVAFWAGPPRRAQERAVDRAWEGADRPDVRDVRWRLEARLEATVGMRTRADVDATPRIERAAVDVAAEALWTVLAGDRLTDADRELLLAPWRSTFG